MKQPKNKEWIKCIFNFWDPKSLYSIVLKVIPDWNSWRANAYFQNTPIHHLTMLKDYHHHHYDHCHNILKGNIPEQGIMLGRKQTLLADWKGNWAPLRWVENTENLRREKRRRGPVEVGLDYRVSLSTHSGEWHHRFFLLRSLDCSDSANTFGLHAWGPTASPWIWNIVIIKTNIYLIVCQARLQALYMY